MLAIIEAWNHRARCQRSDIVHTDWDTYYFPPTTFYLRELHDTELVQIEGSGASRGIWYGVIDSRGERIVDRARTPAILFRLAQTNDLTLVYVH